MVLPHFTKNLNELVTLQDKWLYTFRHLAELSDVPSPFAEAVFSHLFAIAELARFDPKDQQSYEDSLKALRDLHNSEQTARLEGLQEGEQIGLEKGELQGKRKTALKMLAKGMEVESVAELVELPLETVQACQRGEG